MFGNMLKVKAGACVLAFVAIGLLISGCPISSSAVPDAENVSGQDDPSPADDGSMRAVFQGPSSVFAYRNGLKSALSISDSALTTEYNNWKAKYVTSSGAGGFLRVQRDNSSFQDTVSEGVAYGMLIALYCDDIQTFDSLYKYAMLHRVRSDINLMHWKVKADGTDVDEYRLPVLEPSLDDTDSTLPGYLVKDVGGRGTTIKNWAIDRDEERLYVSSIPDGANKKNYLRASKFGRSKSSAADADFDMAAALVLASYKVSSNTAPYYRDEAAKMIKTIIDRDFTNRDDYWFIRNGTAWGGWGVDANNKPYSWNPSYFTPAWFKLFMKFIDDNSHISSVTAALTDNSGGSSVTSPATAKDILSQVIANGYTELAKYRTTNNSVLPPDWCSTRAGTSVMEPATESDRYYYLDENMDGKIDDKNGNGYNGDSGYDSGDAYGKMMSYNFYYDAVRVPWRLAVDYSWYGDTRASGLLTTMRDFFYNKGSSLVDGYYLDGSAWKRANRDGFNNFTPGTNPGLDGGQWTNNTTFVAMCGAAFMVGDQTKANTWGSRVLSTNDNAQPKFNYYGNTTRMLSLLYMSGKFTNVTSKVSLKSDNNQNFVSADVNRGASLPLYASSSTASNSCMFDLVAGTSGTVTLRSYANNLYVGITGIDSSAPLSPNMNNQFGVLNLKMVSNSGKIAFLWSTPGGNRYVCVDTQNGLGGRLCTNRSTIGQWERFTITTR
jgi:hypothetical protein